MEGTRCFSMQKVTKEGTEYPVRLAEQKGMPGQLYFRGRLPAEERPAIAIVGARMCSAYGRAQARRYARFYSQSGIQVLSGLALGIDTEAHKGALEGRTPTFAVLGNGADICYPASNRACYQQILDQGGGIISEYPAQTKPFPGYFPARNRIISALADVVLVVEAREKSGALITADFALEQGKSVYAVPGPADSPLSLGCHKLIAEGAGIAFSPEELLKEWKPDCYEIDKPEKKIKIRLARELELVYSGLDLHPKSLEYLAASLHMPVQAVLQALVTLTLEGLAEEVGRNHYVKK